MAFEAETPASAMYADLKTFGHISNKDAAKVLLSGRPSYGGVAPRDRVEERTFLSREVVHAEPGQVPETQFSDFPTAAIDLTARMIKRLGNGAVDAIINHHRSEGMAAMQAALRQYGLDDNLYRNQVNSIMSLSLSNKTDYAVMLVLSFISAGCLGDPGRSAQIVENYVSEKLNLGFSTMETSTEAIAQALVSRETKAAAGLGLARVVDGKIRPRIHKLPATAEGSILGSMPTSSNGISDVGEFVSKRHARIFFSDGAWYVEGLQSTNGTAIIRENCEEVVVEPAKTIRGNQVYPPVQVYPSDIICLASATKFMVLELLDEE